jgi:hypothetical protein
VDARELAHCFFSLPGFAQVAIADGLAHEFRDSCVRFEGALVQDVPEVVVEIVREVLVSQRAGHWPDVTRSQYRARVVKK